MDKVPIKPPVLQYRLITFDETGTRFSIHAYTSEVELNNAAAKLGKAKAIACSVDYLVNGGDEGALTEADLTTRRRRKR